MAVLILTDEFRVGIDDKLLAMFSNRVKMEHGTVENGIFELELVKVIETALNKELETMLNEKIENK